MMPHAIRSPWLMARSPCEGSPIHKATPTYGPNGAPTHKVALAYGQEAPPRLTQTKRSHAIRSPQLMVRRWSGGGPGHKVTLADNQTWLHVHKAALTFGQLSLSLCS